jgi:predicted phage terminase large subunit-like protein
MCVVGLGQDRNIYVLDWIRDKLNLREREDALFYLHKKYKPKYVLYERYGMQLDAEYMKKAMDERNYRFFITEIGGSLSKEDRIRRLIPYFFEQRIFLPEVLIKTDYEGVVVDLIEEFIEEEYLAFPVGIHDDMLDAFSRLFDAQLEWPGGNTVDYYQLYKGR